MDDAALASAVDANYWASFGLLAAACGGQVLERNGIFAVSTGFPVAMLNIGFITRPVDDPEHAIKEIAGFYDDQGLPFVVRIREGVDPASEEAAAALAMPYSDTVPGMALFPIVDPPALVAGLTVELVRDEPTLVSYRQVMADGFGMPLKMVERMIGPSFLEASGFLSFLARVDGQPVATSSLYAAEGTAGVYNVATLGAFRGRGIGAAVTWEAVVRGRELGCTVATLQASVMGKPVYERMGFRTVAPYLTFRRPD